MNKTIRKQVQEMLGPMLTSRGFAIRKDPTKYAIVASKHEDDIVFYLHVYAKNGLLYADLQLRFDATRDNLPIGGNYNIPIQKVAQEIDKDMEDLRACARRNSAAIDSTPESALRNDLAAAGYLFEPTADGWFMSCPAWDSEITVAYSKSTPGVVSIALECGGLEPGGVAIAIREETHRAAESVMLVRQLAYANLKAFKQTWTAQRQQRSKNQA